jgi:hypothetical protein
MLKKVDNYVSLPDIQDKEKRLLFFTDHFDRFFRALIGADTAPFTEPKVNFELFAYCLVRAVHRTEPALVTFLLVHDRAEYTP